MGTFIATKTNAALLSFEMLVEHIYLRARSSGYTREEAIKEIEKDLKTWMDNREDNWERFAEAETSRNEHLRASLIKLRAQITLVLRDGT